MPSQTSSAIESIELLASLDAITTLLRVVCDLSGLKFAAVAEVSEQRWTACAVHDRLDYGLAVGTELELEATFCSHVRSSHDPVIIADVAQDPAYCDHPLPQLYGWGSYVSLPVFRPNGTFFGTLCGFDRVPAPLLAQPSTIVTLEGFARLLGELIAHEEQRRDETPGPRSDSDLQALREQLLALLDDDLHRPLQRLSHAAAAWAEQLPAVHPWQAEARQLARRSADGADFVRARLGHGPLLKPTLVNGVNEAFEALIGELVVRCPDRRFSTALPASPGALRLDLPHLLRALEAVLEFGVAGSAPGGVIHLQGEIKERTYRLQVEYPGPPLEAATLPQLFQPRLVTSGTDASPRLEVGLYLAQEIVRGHGGVLTARTQDGRNRLTLTLPTALD
ncbi:GAF domain-containing protein [Pseudomonas sp. EpS/L25]|uniref:GAF domain-containing protein n=1 Tax=Pseudomonas sp. EpS/L25 TaxID=1749078 RepID=UPI000743C90A|nr:GAF domain-containing protein [Pseudomonas sp. EpS/L25]KUM34161.1 histidine kinase [Pseudomonas sp. EpS/L25]